MEIKTVRALTERPDAEKGSQQVAGIDELRRHALHHRNVLAVFAGLDKLPHPQGIGHGVDRLHLRPSGALVLAVLVLRVLLLDMASSATTFFCTYIFSR